MYWPQIEHGSKEKNRVPVFLFSVFNPVSSVAIENISHQAKILTVG